MRWNIKLFLVAAGLAVGLAACSSGAQTQPAAGDPLAVSLSTTPEPAVMGNVELVIEVQDTQGKPVTGATVEVGADHTGMSGMTMGGQASEQGNGRYAITADFSMAGNWKVTVYVRKEGLDFKKDFEVQVR